MVPVHTMGPCQASLPKKSFPPIPSPKVLAEDLLSVFVAIWRKLVFHPNRRSAFFVAPVLNLIEDGGGFFGSKGFI